MIRLSDIRKSYRDGENRLNGVLRGVNMEVEKGGFVAIKGPSGCGKTTLLSILGTLLAPDGGMYLLNGADMTRTGANRPEVRNRQIGFVFQNHLLMPQYTAFENILLPALAFASQTTREQSEYARELLELTRIPDTGNRYPHTLSGGEASRVAICRALIMKPVLLLADEPTGQLDAGNARNVASLLADINERLGTTIVMATHSDAVAGFARRTLALRDGVLTEAEPEPEAAAHFQHDKHPIP
ncbi:MAG: ABC transporter ATP-binding protein [Tannerella sp.]|jgi:ABC-type lipoprotein export system ATPase subunit|nr:ABC transporter ATP-binding protein [Tannerella sp.]